MSNRTRAQRRATASVWALAVGIVLAVIWATTSLPNLFSAMTGPIDAANAYGTMFGSSLFMGIVLWGVIYVTAVARLAPQRGLAYFAILVTAALATEVALFNMNPPVRLHSREEDRAQTNIALRSLKSAMDGVLKSQPGGSTVDLRPAAKGDIGVIEGLTRQLWAQDLADQQACKAQMAAIGFPKFMEPGRIALRGGVTAAQAGLSQASTIVQKCRVIQEGHLNAFREGIRNSKIDDPSKRAILENLKQSYNDTYEEMDALWNLDAEILTEYEMALDVLARARGRWTVYRNQIRFSDRNALEDFNSHILRAKQLADTETSRRAADRDKWQNSISGAINAYGSPN